MKNYYLRTKVKEVFTPKTKIIMKLRSNSRLLVAAVAILALSFMASCAASNNQKYGCPNHLHISAFFIR